jgi:hypothetical protein
MVMVPKWQTRNAAATFVTVATRRSKEAKCIIAIALSCIIAKRVQFLLASPAKGNKEFSPQAPDSRMFFESSSL